MNFSFCMLGIDYHLLCNFIMISDCFMIINAPHLRLFEPKEESLTNEKVEIRTCVSMIFLFRFCSAFLSNNQLPVAVFISKSEVSQVDIQNETSTVKCSPCKVTKLCWDYSVFYAA
ncbi:hypothetical protein RchiOBHm_Chr2g0100431 [Rosa chinensis]|uniref:Uncharacterized protein n=1 Tax=Rosa chinensis TaxID=74649 RepID=A0A2P6RM57_ROSCH|nr:hypothetical protein RchiOBHm_Chr2g0100431 [Rosa chinensis]